MIDIKKIIQITLLGLAFMVSSAVGAFSKDYDAEIQAAQAEVDAAKKTMDNAKKTMDDANTKYQSVEDNYKNEKAPHDDEKARLLKQISEEYDDKIKDAQVIADNCLATEIDCVAANQNLVKLKSEKEKKIQKVNDDHKQKIEAIDDKYKEQLEQAKKTYETAKKEYEKAEKAYNKAVDKLNDAKGDKEKAEDKANEKEKKEDEKALKDAQKDIEKANKEFENAQKDMAKFCDTSSDNYNQKKCSKAQEDMSEAQKKKEEAQGRIDDYYEKYPNETPSESGGSDDGPENSGEEGEDEGSESGGSEDGGTSEEPKKDPAEVAAEYNKLKSASDNANKDYEDAQKAFSDAEKAYYEKAFECVRKGKTPDDCAAELSAAQSDLERLKAEADAAYAEKLKADSELNAFLGENPDMNFGGKKNAYESLDSKVNSLQREYEQAAANCEFAKTFTTNAGKLAMEEYCALADSLKQQLEQATAERDAAKEAYEAALKERSLEDQGYFFMAAEGKIYDVYKTDTDVFKTVTRRASRILLALKPIVYLFGAFGLVGFAFAAIFNKISWKWFANISIGLFLVANMGRLIEYMVFPNSNTEPLEGHIDSVIAVKPLSAFEDTIKSDIKISEALGDADYEYVEPVTPYNPTPPKQEVLPNITEPEDPIVEESEEFGFCQEGAGLAKCVEDIMGFIQNVTDTVNTVKNTASRIGVAGEAIEANVNNILAAIKKINPLKPRQMLDALSEINNSIQSTVGTINDTINTIDKNANDVGGTWGNNENGEGSEGEEEENISKEALQNAVNSLNNIGNGVDSALSTLKGLVDALSPF